MPRPRLPFTRRRAETPAAESPPSSTDAKEGGDGKPSPTPKPAATPTPSPSPKPSATPEAPADPQERIDGLRAWVAQVDRKLGVRTYVGAAVAVLALAAAAVGLVLTLSLQQDAATDSDVQSLRDQISAVEQSASQAAEEDVQALERRLTELEDEVSSISTRQTTTRRELKVVQDDIEELRSQVSSADSSAGDASQGSSAAALGTARRPVPRYQAPGGPPASCDDSHEACLHASGESSTVASWGRRDIAALRHTQHTRAVPERRSHRCQPVTA